MKESERKEEVLKLYARYYGEEALKVERYVDYCFTKDELTQGCYAGMFPKGIWTTVGEHLVKPFGRIHWAGNIFIYLHIYIYKF